MIGIRPRLAAALSLLAFLAAAPLIAQAPVLLKDIAAGANGSDAAEFLRIGDTVFFGANEGILGQELWKSDGTLAGTTLVKDINPVGSGLNDRDPNGFFAWNGTLFFVGDDGATGAEVWKSDGTAAGTVLVADIRPGPNGSTAGGFVPFGGFLYFLASDDGLTIQLWRTDGTGPGTTRVVHRPGVLTLASGLTAAFGSLFFAGGDAVAGGASGLELWASDGSDGGTAQLKDINPGPGSSLPQGFLLVGPALYFLADDGSSGVELWKTDGTALGTVRVKDIRAGAPDGALGSLTALGGELFFVGHDGATGAELWKSDGTDLGTILVRDITPGNTTTTGPTGLVAFAGRVFFAASGANGRELWRSDGTEAGTVEVSDLFPGTCGGNTPCSSSPEGMAVNGDLFFSAVTGVGREPWTSDGTAAGTALVQDLRPGGNSSDPGPFAAAGARLYFAANNGVVGTEPWTIAVDRIFGDGFEGPH